MSRYPPKRVRCSLQVPLALAAVAALLLMAAARVPASSAEALPTGTGVRLLSSSSEGITLEVTLDPDAVRLRTVSVDGQEYVAVSVPDWTTTGNPGAPALPMAYAGLAIPFGVDLDVRVVPGPMRVVQLDHDVQPEYPFPVGAEPDGLPPGSGLPLPLEPTQKDETIYASAGPYPGKLAEVVSDGVLRQQRIAGVVAYPVQVRPQSRTLEIYEKLIVEVRFTGMSAEAALPPPRPDSSAIEGLLDGALLNADSAAQWRSPSTLAAGTQDAPWAPPEPGYKIQVEQEGIYKLTYSALQAAGVPVDQVDPRTFRIYTGGSEEAIYVEGEADGRFDGSDYLLFYGRPLQSKYTRYNVYWLGYGQGLGLRMASRDGTPTSGAVPAAYRDTLHAEQNAFYVPILPGDESLERFLWSYVYPPSIPSWSHTISVPAPLGGQGTATLRVAMFGYLNSIVNPDHHTRLYVNGLLVEDAWWDGITWRYSEVEFPESYLVTGNNVVRVECPNDSGVGYDIVEIDWVELEYNSGFEAVDDVLGFSYEAAGEWKYELDGFGSNDLVVFDITQPGTVTRITGASIVPSGPGYLVRFRDVTQGTASYLALSRARFLAPVSIEADVASNLRSHQNGADYLVIAHPSFSGAMSALRDYRASQGMRAQVVDVRDVYDEFGFGVVGPAAIRDFLLYTYHYWQAPAPAYVLLVGDGHYDPKNLLGYGRTSYMPPYLAPVDPWLGETASDNRYVALTEGDQFPDMIIGRFPANTSEEASVMVAKAMAYEQAPAPGDWSQDLLFVADNTDEGGNFPGVSDAAIDCCVPDPYTAEKVYYLVTHQTPVAARLAIIDAINAGKLIVNYVGHAAVGTWASESLFATVDIGSLANATKLPVILSMTCYDGYFINPQVSAGHSLAESFVRASGKGAVASWSPTGLGVASGHDLLDRGFLSAVLLEGEVDLGGATMAGKLRLWSTGMHLDLIDTYVLFGDPALRLNLLEADTGITKSVEPGAPLLPDDPITYTLSVTNQGPDLAFHVVLTDLVPDFVVESEVVFSSLDISLRPGTEFVWDVENLDAGESGTIVIRGRVDPAAGVGWFENVAQVEAGNREVGTLPNEASVASQAIAGPPAAVTVSADPAQVPVGGAVSTIVAEVTDAWGNPVADGTQVDFAASLGTLNPISGQTQDGAVSTLLTSGMVPGVSLVTASAGGPVGSVEVTFVAGPPASMQLAADPLAIPVGGAASSLVAAVRDAYGNPVQDGTLVSFATSRGTVSPSSVPTLAGVAQATLTSGAQAGLAVVTAQSGGAQAQVGVLFAPGPPSQVSLAAGSPSVPVNGQTGLLASVLDAWGNPVADGTPVAFATDLGSVSPPGSTTLNGQAASTFLAGTVAGPASIVASAGSASGSTGVLVLPGAPAALTVTASPQSIPLNGVSELEALVLDAYGNAAADGTVVSFSTTMGAVDPPSSGTTGGVATSTLHAPGEPGVAIVTAQAGPASGSVQVTIGEGTPMEMVLTADPEQIVADGASTSTITALVLDAFGEPITGTLPIAFATTLGQVDPPQTWLVDGQAVTYLSGTQSGLAAVTAQAAGVSGVVTVQMVAGPPGSVTLSSPASVPVGGQATLQVVVTDSFGNPVADGTEVAFSSTLGSAEPPVVTTMGGAAQSTFLAGWVSGSALVTAASGTAMDSALVLVLAGPPAAVTLDADPPAIVADGEDQSAVTATVTDGYGNPVADGTQVLFSTTRGSIDPLAVPTSQGQAQTTLTAGTAAGVAVVSATGGAATGTLEVPFVPGPAASLALAAVPPSLPADGQSQSAITAAVADAFGNPVADGTPVAFGTTLGSVSPASVPTQGGVAQSLLTSGTQAGVAVVSAGAGAAAGTVDVTFEAGPAALISLAADPSELIADGVSTAVLTAAVTDGFGNVVADGTMVYFSTSLGSVYPVSSPTEDGLAIATFRAGLTVGVAQVSAWSGPALGTAEIDLLPGPLALLVLEADPDTILADHQSSSTITTHALDAWGRAVVDGTPLWFASTNGNIDPAAGFTSGGWFTNTLFAGWTVGPGVVTAQNGGVHGSTTVHIVAGPPVAVTVTAGRGSLPDPSGSWLTYVDALVQDSWGHRVTDGTPVTFSASLGGVAPQVALTVGGVARTWYTGVPAGEMATITASAAPGVEDSVQVWLEKRYRIALPLVLRGSGR